MGPLGGCLVSASAGCGVGQIGLGGAERA